MITLQDTPKSGGISNASGSRIAFNAGSGGSFQGDIIAGNKIIHETTAIYGFEQETDKADFLKQIERLRAILREIRNGFVTLDNLDENQKAATISAFIAISRRTRTTGRRRRSPTASSGVRRIWMCCASITPAPGRR